MKNIRICHCGAKRRCIRSIAMDGFNWRIYQCESCSSRVKSIELLTSYGSEPLQTLRNIQTGLAMLHDHNAAQPQEVTDDAHVQRELP